MNGMKISAGKWNMLINAVVKLEGKVSWDGYNAATHKTSQARLAQARENLRTAMKDAEWGSNGCAFVTRRSEQIASMRYCTSVYINNRLRAEMSDSGWVRVYTQEEAEETYQTLKENRRQALKEYLENREAVARLLWKSNITEMNQDMYGNPNDEREVVKGWTYYSGQEGGLFQMIGEGGVTISASGALNRAKEIESEEGPCISGPDWQDCMETLQADRKYHGTRY